MNKLKAFEDIKKAEIMQEKQRLEAMKRGHRGDKMSEKLEVIICALEFFYLSGEVRPSLQQCSKLIDSLKLFWTDISRKEILTISTSLVEVTRVQTFYEVPNVALETPLKSKPLSKVWY